MQNTPILTVTGCRERDQPDMRMLQPQEAQHAAGPRWRRWRAPPGLGLQSSHWLGYSADPLPCLTLF